MEKASDGSFPLSAGKTPRTANAIQLKGSEAILAVFGGPLQG
jgi:hypothetical protein